jgi:predicted helicase
VVHFYETFLASYDPKMREARGVYYTPEPVVGYIVRSVDLLLQQHFHKASGLADEHTVILDPATGTGTFLNAVVDSIHETLDKQGMASYWNSYVPDKLLPRLFGFELLMAPYTIAHMKLGLLLKDQGYQFERDERLGVYLTNALESLPSGQQTLPFAQFIAEEGKQADDVKQHQPVMVVLGNPPYSNFGMLNKSDWIRELLEDYKKGLKEKKINLDDDFIKFIRFGQWRIERTGAGILAFITSNTYLDGITHRRMRQSLMETFTDIYILNLHGNSRKKG